MVLRNVPKTFTFEEQRVEINQIAQDLYDLDNSYTAFIAGLITTTVSINPNPWQSGLLEYDDATKIFTYTPPDLSGFLSSESDPVFTGHVAYNITSQNITDWTGAATSVTNGQASWNSAYQWGNHANQGYRTLIVSTDDTSPTNPVDGDLWWKSDEGQLKIYYEDTDSSQWVDAINSPPGIDEISELIDVNLSSLNDGDILKYDQANSKWVSQPEAVFGGLLYNSLSVTSPAPANGSGGIAYDDTNGEFTYTPPDLGSFWVEDTAKITSWDQAASWGNHATQGYLTGISNISIGALNDVDVTTTAPQPGEGLVWDNVSQTWVPGTVGGGAAGLSQQQVRASFSVGAELPASGDGAISYDPATGIFYFTPPVLTGFLTTQSAAASVTTSKISAWDEAAGWGDHSTEGYLTSQTSHADVVVDGDFTTAGLMKTDGSGTYSIVTDNSSNWNTAHGWGNHASGGYLTSLGAAAGVTTQKISDWDEAHGWGDHSTEGYLTSTPAETDPTVPTHVKNITQANITAWNGAGTSNVSSINDLSDVETASVSTDDVLKWNGSAWTPQTDVAGAGGFPSGTRMLFQQSSAPTGWTKDTSANDEALRVVSGSVSSGGSVGFTTAMSNRTPSGNIQGWNVSSESPGGSLTNWNVSSESTGGTVNNHTISSNQMPSHSHRPIDTTQPVQSWGVDSGQDAFAPAYSGNTFLNNAADTSSSGGGSSHSHGFTGGSHSHDVSASFNGSNHSHTVSASFSGNNMDFRVKYRDVIFASKD